MRIKKVRKSVKSESPEETATGIMAVQISVKESKKKKLSAFKIAESIKTGYNEMLQIENGQLEEKSFEQFFGK